MSDLEPSESDVEPPHIVAEDDDGIRPAGPPDACLYCRSKVGERHSAECVMVEKTVTIELTVRMTTEVPRSWDATQVEFHFNDSNYCIDNLVRDLRTKSEPGGSGCLCDRARVKLLETD